MRSRVKWLIASAVVGVVVAAAWSRYQKSVGSTDMVEREWPLPNLFFWKQRAVWSELGLSAEQVRLLVSYEQLPWTEEEQRELPFRSGTDYADQAVKVRRIEPLLSDFQRKRLKQLELQYMGTLAAEVPEVAQELGLPKSQQRAIQIVKELFEKERNYRWRTWFSETERDYAGHGTDFSPDLGGLSDSKLPTLKAMERQAIRSLLTEGQKAKLDRLMGEPASVVKVYPDFSQSASAELTLRILTDPKNWERLQINRQQIPQSIVSRKGAAWSIRSFQEDCVALASIWKTLSPAQKLEVLKLELPHIHINQIVREDIRVLLGITEVEHDRLLMKLADEDHFSHKEYLVRNLRNLRYHAKSQDDVDSVSLSKDGLVGTGEVRYESPGSGLWGMLRPETRKRWLQLGGKPPRAYKSYR